MPAIMTHDFFGRDILSDRPDIIGASSDERDAFLLGNQGPDPLFYLVVTPKQRMLHRLGSTMHDEQPAQLLSALKQSLSVLNESERSIGAAYASGFLCHYTLDSHEHPLIFAMEYRICDAGVEGLTRESKSEVHGVIESELDEMVLYNKRGLTIAHYAPYENILKASDTVLDTIAKMYAFMVLSVYGQIIQPDTFPLAVRKFRRTQHYLFYSPTGAKRAVLSRVEETVHPYSFLRSMAHRPIELESVWFENREHATWENPFTGKPCTASFWDLYETSRFKALHSIAAFNEASFGEPAAHAITNDLNFSGEPVEATLVVHSR